jgi:hypothetical protein
MKIEKKKKRERRERSAFMKKLSMKREWLNVSLGGPKE